MVFPEHMEFRYYITPERKEHFALYDRTLGSRMTCLESTQDLGQCLIDLYDTDFYDAYCTLAEINKLVRAEKDEAAWRKLLGLSMPLCEVHPFFGLLVKERLPPARGPTGKAPPTQGRRCESHSAARLSTPSWAASPLFWCRR